MARHHHPRRRPIRVGTAAFLRRRPARVRRPRRRPNIRSPITPSRTRPSPVIHSPITPSRTRPSPVIHSRVTHSRTRPSPVIHSRVTRIIGTGIYYAVSNDKSPFVRHHVTEALNFSITLAIAWTATFVLSIVLIGFLIMPFLMLWGFIMPILAAVAANKGEWYRYPATLRLVKGPLDQPGGVQGYGGQGY